MTDTSMQDMPVEIERKYVILKPELSALTACGEVESSDIEQTYLHSKEGVTRRVRRRVYRDREIYTETLKRRIDRMSSYEDERQITREEYYESLAEKKEGTVTVRKTRHVLTYRGVCFEIDVYPEWEHTCILETELKRRDEHPAFPSVIKVVCEVTGDKKYSNAAMSHSFPKELI